MKTRKFEIIECPKCGREYLPAEIFYPKHFFGRPYDIVRDVYGRILDYDGTSVDTCESYTCDKCMTQFNVRAKMTFIVESTKFESMEDPYTQTVVVNTLFSDN